MIPYLRHLATHSAWADARLLDAVSHINGDCTAVLRELAHIRGAQAIWLARLEGSAPTLPVWPTLTADELAELGATLDAAWHRIIDALTPDALEQYVSYRNLAGAERRTKLGDILVHLFMHGQMHRGKANVALRTAGVDAVSVDYIAWVGERETAAR